MIYKLFQSAIKNHIQLGLHCFQTQFTLYHGILTFIDHDRVDFWKHCGERKKYCNYRQDFSFSHNNFNPSTNEFQFFKPHLYCHLQQLLFWRSLEICCLVYIVNIIDLLVLSIFFLFFFQYISHLLLIVPTALHRVIKDCHLSKASTKRKGILEKSF